MRPRSNAARALLSSPRRRRCGAGATTRKWRMTRDDRARRYRTFWQEEVDSAFQYRAMSEHERDEAVAHVYRDLGAVERKHVGFWEQQLHSLGVEPGERRPSWRARVLAWSARTWGARAVLPTVAAHEHAGRDRYARQVE